jgi:hypothetical protein
MRQEAENSCAEAQRQQQQEVEAPLVPTDVVESKRGIWREQYKESRILGIQGP